MSQFKKPKGIMNRSPSPLPSQVERQSNAKSNHISNQSQNYLNELQKANEKNQNLMTSLLNDGTFDVPETPQQLPVTNSDSPNLLLSNKEIPKIDILNEKSNTNYNKSSLGSKLQPVDEKSKLGQPSTNQERPSIQGNSPLPARNSEAFRKKSGIEIDNNATKTNPSINTNLAQTNKSNIVLPGTGESVVKGPTLKEQLTTPTPLEPVTGGFYKNNLEQVLMVITLKKIVKHLQLENTKLKEKSQEQDFKESDYVSKIKKLESKLEEYQLKEKLWNKQPSDYIKFDLEDLNVKLKNIDQNLDNATADNVQEKFLEEVVVKNRDYSEKSETNSAALRALRDNLGRLKNTLLTMNNM